MEEKISKKEKRQMNRVERRKKEDKSWKKK